MFEKLKSKRIGYRILNTLSYARKMGGLHLLKYELECIKHLYGSKKRKSVMKVKSNNYNISLLLRKNSSDLYAFGNICLDESYEEAFKEFDKISPVKYIVDAGANIGIVSKILKQRYPAASIVCLEPEDGNFEMLKQNMKDFQNVYPLKNAVWNKTAKLEVFSITGEDYEFTCRENPNGNITAMSMQDIMDRYSFPRIDILKMDIEGSELMCFDQSSDSWIKNLKMLVIEIHGEDCYNKVHETMIKNRFTEKKLSTFGSVYLYSSENYS